MQNTTKNTLTFISGVLLLAALLVYLTNFVSIAQNILLIAASILTGFPIVIKAFQALRMRVFSIDMLVTIAVVGAIIIGEYTEAAVVTFLFMFGDYLEGRTLKKTRSSFRSLLDMAPQEATVIKNGRKVIIAVDEVKIGDTVIIQPGTRVPVDGKVLIGQALLNESAITGESVPVTKRIGDRVFSGTISDSGYLEILAEEVGEDTTFAKIIDLVEEAQEAKAKTQKLMERFATYYTPGIIVLSILVWVISQNVHLALIFLVIACPGALVISVPVSIVAGIGNGAKHGILIKGGDKMESLSRVKTVVFDKTGTLTKGSPKVTGIKSFGISEGELLRLAAEVEVVSEHHLGKAIIDAAEDRGIIPQNQPSKVITLKGHGIQAKLENRNVYIGNKAGVLKLGILLDGEVDSYITTQEALSNTAVLMALSGKIVGVISIADQVREEAPRALHLLRQSGIQHTVMLTGDNEKVAKSVAEQLEIDQVYAELLPHDKVDKVNEFKDAGIKLAMVGDGINDAPAIATADIGIAMGGTATDVTMQTADVILISDKLDTLPYAIQLAKATVRNMKQNIYISLITVAFLLLGVLTDNIHLASGMLIHEASVLLVILNAVRLVRFPKSHFNPTSIPFLPTSNSSALLSSEVSLYYK